jgi:hypothetical protein
MALAVALTPPEQLPTYTVYLTYFEPSGNYPGETWEEFYARYPDAPRPFVPDIVLSFGDDPQRRHKP